MTKKRKRQQTHPNGDSPPEWVDPDLMDEEGWKRLQYQHPDAHDDPAQFNIIYAPVKSSGACSVCFQLGDTYQDPSATPWNLVIFWSPRAGNHQELVLCPHGEAVLLQKLLHAYLRRKKGREAKNTSVGYRGPLEKPTTLVAQDAIVDIDAIVVEEPDGASPSAAERLNGDGKERGEAA